MAWTVNLTNNSLNAQVLNAIADGSFSYQEVLQLLNTVAVGGLTPSELGDLQTIDTNCAELFASDYVKTITHNVIYGNKANTTWWGGKKLAVAVPQGNLTGATSEADAQRLVAEWFLGTDLPIAVAGGDTATGKASTSSFNYSNATGSLYENGVAASDVTQGSAGTCYFLAAIGAIANANPSYITNAITDNGNGTYGVRLYLDGVAIYTTVNAALPTSLGKLPFAGNVTKSTTGELWVALMEKAYAQLNAQVNVQGETSWKGESSYQAIEGGYAYAIKEITGLNYKYYTKQNYTAFDNFSAGVVQVNNGAELKQKMITALSAGAIGWLGVSHQKYVDPVNGKENFVAGPGSGHAYMLLGYNSATDKFIVRNPWGGDGTRYFNPQFEVSADTIWEFGGLVALTDTTIADPVYSYAVSSNAGSTAAAVSEGGDIVFTITRSGSNLAFSSTVYVSTAPGSADNNDFQAVSKLTISFAANETSKTVAVKSFVDALTEGIETFSLNVYKQLTDTTSIATSIANIKDVTPKSYTYAVASSTANAASAVTEGGKIDFTITRSATGAGTDTASTVYVSTAGISANANDFVGLTKVAVNFAAFDVSKTVAINATLDNETEGTESFSLDLYQNIGDSTKTTSAIGYIKDQNLPNFSYSISSDAATPGTAAYEGGKVSFTITRSGTGVVSTVYISTETGSAGSADFVGINARALTFAANQSAMVVTVDINKDTWLESVEYFKLKLYKLLSDTTYSSSSIAYIREPVAVVNEYSYTVSSSASSAATAVIEGGSITFTVTRSASGTASTVYLSTSDNTTSASDYQGISKTVLSFAANETVKTVSIKTNSDTQTEVTEYFQLNLYKNLVDTTAFLSAQGYIKDPVAAVAYSYTITNPSSSAALAATEGAVITFTIARSSSGTESTVYVGSWNGTATSSGGDYQATGITAITFAANQTVKTFAVTSYADALTEGAEYFFLCLYKTQADADAFNYATYSTAYLKDPVAVVDYSYTVSSSASSAATAVTEGGLITFTVTRSASGSASTVYLSTQNASTVAGDYQGVDKLAMNFAANETVKTITVATNTDSLVEGSEYFWLNVYKSYADALSGTEASYGAGYIKDPAVVATNYSYTITNPSSSAALAATEGAAITFTITRSSSGTESTVYVGTGSGTASAAGGDYLLSTGLTAITFAANQTVKTITVTSYADTLTEGTEYFFLSLYKTQADADAFNYATYSAAYIKDPVLGTGGSIASDTALSGLQFSPSENLSNQATSLLSTPVIAASFPGHSLGKFQNSFAFAALKSNGAVVTWGFAPNGGDSSSVADKLNGDIAVTKIFSTDSAFAALRTDGSVVSWGNANLGGNNSSVSVALNGSNKAVQIFSTASAFAALRADGSVITWGSPGSGADSSSVGSQLDGSVDVSQIFSTMSAFAALRVDGSVVTWGFDLFGGDSSSVASQLSGAIAVSLVCSSSSAFAALRVDGSVVTWGSLLDGGNSSAVANKVNGSVGVVSLSATTSAFAALRQDGSVVTWGDVNNGGNSDTVSDKVNGAIGVSNIVSTNSAFAALRADGSVVTWGSAANGGDSSKVASSLNGDLDVVAIYATMSAFAALRADGSVITWGYVAGGGDSSEVAFALNGSVDVKSIVANDHAFAALKADGSVVTWGSFLGGGDSSGVLSQLNGSICVTQIYPTSEAFSALRTDGSIVTWGESNRGGDGSSVLPQLSAIVGLSNVYSKTTENGRVMVGGQGNDSFVSGTGDDSIDGGAGIDCVTLSGSRNSYTLIKTASGWTVSSSTDGIDTIQNVERLKFSDATVALDTSGVGGQAYRVYKAAFNRTPDVGGLGFWISGMDGGVSLNAVAQGFVNSAEFKAVYGASPTNAQIVTRFYDNVLGRAAESGGYNYWLGILDSGQASVAGVLAAFSESPENQAAVIGVIGNGILYMPYG